MAKTFYQICILWYLSAHFAFIGHAQTPAFAKGADVSWVTEMEASGRKFYNKAGAEQDIFRLLRDDYGLNTIRLRVWVNPANGYNGPADVLAKARRAQALGMRLLIDFHYSDSWADPGQQTKPAAWQNYTLAQLKQAVYDHTTAVLTLLKDNGITPEWVQVGNENNDGMLWPEGRITVSGFASFAQLIDQGYAAVKDVSPTTKVIVHFANGYNNGAFRYFFDGLKNNGARWDVIGLSLYPDAATWNTFTAQTQANMNDMVTRYPGKEVMVVETGMPNYLPVPTREMLYDLIQKTKAVAGGKGLGVVYWEPQAYNWQSYNLGAWQTNGHATSAMDGFLAAPAPTLIYNPGFEYTAATSSPLGWTTTGDAAADYTEEQAHNGLFRLTHYKSTAYQVTTYQQINNVPNGTYTFQAWVRNGGGQTTCQLFARGFGSPTELAQALPLATTWTLVQVPGIVVTNGQCEIGLRSTASAGNYCSLDDAELIPANGLSATPAALPALADLYPNPATDVIYLNIGPGNAATDEVALYTLSGQLVGLLATGAAQAAGAQGLRLHLPATIPGGVYILRISSGRSIVQRKIVKL
jgi:arabinogalactan endo-1,4-beta-galactosidase